jgi:hypothetical protein
VDAYNLLYVAASRAKVALVVNPDVEQLLLSGSYRPLLLQVGAAHTTSSSGWGAQGLWVMLLVTMLHTQRWFEQGDLRACPGLASGCVGM